MENSVMEHAPEQASFACREDRIRYYESILNEAEETLSAYEPALERFAALQKKLAELNGYYGSKAWWEDFDASETGKLPAGLPCGVLSEDGVWDLLCRNRELIEHGASLAEALADASSDQPEEEEEE